MQDLGKKLKATKERLAKRQQDLEKVQRAIARDESLIRELEIKIAHPRPEPGAEKTPKPAKVPPAPRGDDPLPLPLEGGEKKEERKKSAFGF